MDVTERTQEEGVREVLRSLAWRGTVDELDEITAPYADGHARLYALIVDGGPASCIGVSRTGTRAELWTVATRAARQRLGFASELLQRLIGELHLEVVSAETDDDSVGFYRSAGFSTESLGERHPGVIRYRCTLRQPSRTK